MAIKFNQQVWLKPYIDMNTELKKKKKQKRIVEKVFQPDDECSFWKNHGK